MASYPGFLGPASAGQSYMADHEVCRNWYLEKNESPNAPQPYALLPTPGVTRIASVSQAPIRGVFAQHGRAFFVAGFAFYELLYDSVTEAWSTTNRGTVNADGNPVTISANGDAGDQLWITSGGVGYVYDLTTNLLSAQGVGGTTVSMGGFLSARFVYLDATTGAFYASAQYDGTSWAGAMVAQSESGDPWRALVVTPDGLIHLLGEYSGEAWADQGASPFPFSKIAGAGIPYGIVSPFAWGVDTALSWITNNPQGRGMVVRAAGYTPERISTHAIEDTLAPITDWSTVTAWKYQERGHSHFVLTLPTIDQTVVFDATSGFWHTRDYWDVTTGTSRAYRPGCMMSAFGVTIVGDRVTGDLYTLASTVHTDVGGAAIRRVRQPPRLSADQRRVTVHSLQVILDAGLGLNTGQGSDPQLMLTTSKDGGETWGNERWASAGAQGDYATRVVWDRCGQARNRVDRFVATDPIPWRLVDCVVELTVGAH